MHGDFAAFCKLFQKNLASARLPELKQCLSGRGKRFSHLIGAPARHGGLRRSSAQGLKPKLIFQPFMARLKSCPDTSYGSERVFPQFEKLCPDTKPHVLPWIQSQYISIWLAAKRS